MKTATLTRKYGPIQTNGELVFDKITIKTIERPWINNKPMVSCIPEGEYICTWSHMQTHNVDHYQLRDVKDRTAIFIHIASKVEQLHGCIGAGSASIGALESWGGRHDFKLIIVPRVTIINPINQ